MTKEEFALEEYKSLREEISNKMERNFNTLSLGVGGITVILGFVFKYNINELFFVLPLLILANIYRYKAEYISILNASEYIRKIENSFYRQDCDVSKCDTDKAFGSLGWENYLKDKRKLYKLHGYAAGVIFGSLYLLSIIELLIRNFGVNMHITILFTFLFVSIGVHLLLTEWKNSREE